jgi:outer membrane protein insertion porin family
VREACPSALRALLFFFGFVATVAIGFIPRVAPAQSSGAAAGGLAIDRVEVRGNRRSESEAILQLVATRAGTNLDRARLQSDVRAIFQMGFYTDVQVDLSEAEGKSVLTFIVTEKASIRSIKFEGNDELDEDDLKAVVDLKEFGILDLAKVTRNAEKLKDLYTEKGYFLAEVNYEVVDLGDNEVDVLFRIVEKQEVKVARITIVGNKALTDTEIKENLETQEGGFLEFLTSAGSFKAEAFERDSMRVNQFYMDKGYITARVGQPKIELSPDKREMYLTIPVEEGERYKTGDIDISGDMLRPKDELMKLVRLEKGEWFSSTLLRETINGIGELYKDEGYAYVNPTPNTNVDPEAKTVSLLLEIDKGKKVRFGRINIVGNARTRDKVIRREMRIYEGEYYSSTGIKRSKQLIHRLGLFRDRRNQYEPRRHRRHHGRRRRGQGEADRYVPGRRRLQLPRELRCAGAGRAEQPLRPRPDAELAGDALEAAHHRQHAVRRRLLHRHAGPLRNGRLPL